MIYFISNNFLRNAVELFVVMQNIDNNYFYVFPNSVYPTCTEAISFPNFLILIDAYLNILDGYQATDVYYRWNSRNSTGDVVYISEDLEMPQFKITNVELEEKTNIYNIGKGSAEMYVWFWASYGK